LCLCSLFRYLFSWFVFLVCLLPFFFISTMSNDNTTTTTTSYTGLQRGSSDAPIMSAVEAPRFFSEAQSRDAIHIRAGSPHDLVIRSSPPPSDQFRSSPGPVQRVDSTDFNAGNVRVGYGPMMGSGVPTIYTSRVTTRAEYLSASSPAPVAAGSGAALGSAAPPQPIGSPDARYLRDDAGQLKGPDVHYLRPGSAGIKENVVAGPAMMQANPAIIQQQQAMAPVIPELPLISGPSDPGARCMPHPHLFSAWGNRARANQNLDLNNPNGANINYEAGGANGIVAAPGADGVGVEPPANMGPGLVGMGPGAAGMAGAGLGAGAGYAAGSLLPGIGGGVVGVGHGGPQAPYGFNRYAEGYSNTTMFIKPIAAPSALGLASFFAAAWMYGTWLAGWFSNDYAPCEFWPWLFIFGGVGQLVASYQSFNARDNMTLVFHWAWGSFFIFISVWFYLTCFGYLPAGRFADPLGHQGSIAWVFLILIFVQSLVLLSSLGRDLIWFLGMAVLETAVILFFLGYIIATGALVKIAAYFLIVASVLTFYRSAAWLIAENHHVGWLPIFTSPLQAYNPIVKIPIGEPGIKKTH
jgi:succinate-acetate transporter protein